jgi:hypothetical protein
MQKFIVALVVLSVCVFDSPASAQTAEPQPAMQHDHAAMQRASWHVMQDAVAFLTFNHQGSDRGGTEFGSQNWWMGMAERPAKGGTLTFNLMLSLDPATVTSNGYREIFQAGETLDGKPLIDRQHPHDVLMQAAAVWRTPLANDISLTLAGAPVGEPALGPVAFMHRSSAFENPTAPLGHHTFDSTHIAMGVVTAGLDRGPWQIESSIFQGREPDENRWDLMDPGALDSWSVRGWYRPTPEWTFQASHGFLNEPEELEPGDVRRTTVSASWNRSRNNGWTAATVAYGRNDKHDSAYNALIAEATHTFGPHALYGRVESLQVEADLLLSGGHGSDRHGDHGPEDPAGPQVVTALTLGGVRTIGRWSGWDAGAGADVTIYGVPTALQPAYGDRPVSFHIFLRVRPPAPMGRMTDVTMTRMMK